MNTRGKIMRLLGQPSTNTTSCEENNASSNLRQNAPHSLAYCVGKEVLCLDRSPDGQRVVIGGPGIFKILKVGEVAITEEIDLRAIILIHATSHYTVAHSSEFNTSFTIVAVKWSHGDFGNVIIAAYANGVIRAYDLKRVSEGLEIARVQAHSRQIHKIAINPHKPQWLLSASRDGTVKSWKIRSPNDNSSIAYFRLWHTFRCTSEVLDVEWSSTDGLAFACCTELGQVLEWDVRDSIKPTNRVNAHVGQCYSIAWHPNGEHIASGGQDKFCYVWDLSKNRTKNPKAMHTIETRAPISSVSWRPAIWSATANAKRAAQITITYQDDRKMDALVEIWDLARPTMPFKKLPYKPRPTPKMVDFSMGREGILEDKPPSDEGWDTAPIGILWNGRDILWTINNTIGTTKSGQSTVREGWLIQSNLTFVPNSIEQKSLSNLTFSPSGEILMILEQRQAVRQRRPTLVTPENSPQFPQSSSPISNRSLSDSEEEMIGQFLGTKQKKGHQIKGSCRSDQTNSSIMGSNSLNGNVMGLEDSIKLTGIYKPRQVMAIGHAPSAMNIAEFHYYSNHYLMWLLKAPKVSKLPNEQISSILEYFAKIAERLSDNRLAQTWRLLGMSMDTLLIRRAEYHRDNRLRHLLSISLEDENPDFTNLTSPPDKNEEKTDQKKYSTETVFLCQKFHDVIKETISEEEESLSIHKIPLAQSINKTTGGRTREAISTSRVEENKPEHSEVSSFTESSPYSSSSLNEEKSGLNSYEAEKIPFSIDDFTPQSMNKTIEHSSGETQGTEKEQTQCKIEDESKLESFYSDEKKERKFVHTIVDDQTTLPSWDRLSDSENKNKKKDSVDQKYLESEPLTNQKKNHFACQTTGSSTISNVKKVRDSFSSHSIFTQENHPSNYNQLAFPKTTSISQAAAAAMYQFPENNSSFILSDFQYARNDPDFTLLALNPTSILQRLIAYHTCTTSTPIHLIPMLLLLLPYLPKDTTNREQICQIISNVHARLNFFQLYIEATILRNLCVPDYPEIYTASQQNIRIGFFCTTCNKPFDPDPRIPNAHWKCSRCLGAMAPCPICEQYEFIFEEIELTDTQDASNDDYDEINSSLSLGTWWYCPGCAHGGHVACMLDWHASSEPGGELGSQHSKGACPVIGCLHPCLAGSWREELAAERTVKKERELAHSVRESAGTTVFDGKSHSIVDSQEAGINLRAKKDVLQSHPIGVSKTILGDRRKEFLSKGFDDNKK